MTIDKNIFIKNVYYMLAYAFQELRRDNYKEIAGEDFDNIYQLFAEILAKGIAHQLKQGLHKSLLRVVSTSVLPWVAMLVPMSSSSATLMLVSTSTEATRPWFTRAGSESTTTRTVPRTPPPPPLRLPDQTDTGRYNHFLNSVIWLLLSKLC